MIYKITDWAYISDRSRESRLQRFAETFNDRATALDALAARDYGRLWEQEGHYGDRTLIADKGPGHVPVLNAAGEIIGFDWPQ
ncbi:MAG TPA: hypothetical protein VF474_16910 [Phenylobacterium sp.]